MICSRAQAEFLALASGRDGVSYLEGQNDRTRPLTGCSDADGTETRTTGRRFQGPKVKKLN